MNDTHLYFAGGFDYVNLPQIYSKASNNVEFLAKSSPTVWTMQQLSTYGSTGFVVGAYSVDFLDLMNGTWSYNKVLSDVMMKNFK